MSPSHIFISHATKDDDFVKELRRHLENFALTVWVDSRNLRGGDKLAPEIARAIENAGHVIVVISQHTVNSPWVRREITKALEVEKRKQDRAYRVIPLLLPGIEPSALANWFDEEPVGVRVQMTTSDLMEALPQILAALGERLPDDHDPAQEADSTPIAELIFKLSDTKVETLEGKTRAKATATLIYEPADNSRSIESQRYFFTAPLGPIETDELRWYLEEYFRWPVGIFKARAARVEAQLPQWGEELFDAALKDEITTEPLQAWLNAAGKAERRFSVMIDRELPRGANNEDQANANEAASLLLSLPWELLHDGRGFLFHGKHPAPVRRRLPNRHRQDPIITGLPIRILLVSPRPEWQLREDPETKEIKKTKISYIDHRISALPLSAACEALGELAHLSILASPTFAALERALTEAAAAGKPFDVIHFDGHGVYDPGIGLGALCFEDPKDGDQLIERTMQLIDAEKLASIIRDHRVPLVFLEACQSAQAEKDPTASVAAKLLEEGVTSVVAMSHSVLVETARRFVTAFYGELARGARIGRAMLAGQQALHGDDFRGRMMGAGDLRLQDWFVPVLYQEAEDLQLITRLPSETVQQLQAQKRKLSLGELPDPPAHTFIGRSRDLLCMERMLANPDQRYAVVRGCGGEGKTTLAVELARWLLRTGRFERAAFVSLEEYSDARGVLDSLGRQLLPEGEKWSVAQFKDLNEARQHVDRALHDRRTILVLDNLESVLPEIETTGDTGKDKEHPRDPRGSFNEIFALCQELLAAGGSTRLLFTSRERLPEPFDHAHRVAELRELSREDAIELVGEVMKREGLEPKYDDEGNTPKEIEELVEAVGCHARALTLLAREIARSGVRATTGNVQQLMADLDRKHPGDRENSLYASVELSLRRLPVEMREQVKVLGVFHGGANLRVLPYVLGVDNETAINIARALIEVGLAEEMGYGHLRLDPALPLLLREMSEDEQEATRSRWAEATRQLTGSLSQQFQNAELAAQLTLLELPNLMALLGWLPERTVPENVVDVATRMEMLLANLGRPQALARATRVREKAAESLGEWSHARFQTEAAQIDRLLERGDLRAAYSTAEQLLERAMAAGENAFPAARYVIAGAHFKLGRVLKMGGAAEAALAPLAEAERRFQALADAGNTGAAGMASASITERADCLADLGRLEEAAAAYQEAIERSEKLDDQRTVAVGKIQLGTVRLRQQRYAEALEIYTEARGIFERLGEPGTVATAWHQIGMVHRMARQFDEAERAHRQSLAIKVQQKNLAGEASSLNELGNLYDTIGGLEEAVTCYRQAADIYVKLQDQRYEGFARNNLANTLIKLERYDDARRELLRAIECDEPYGHAAEPWKTWDILHDLEQATGNAQAAAEARERAMALFLQYRRDGGEICAQLCAPVLQVLQSGDPAQTSALVEKLDEMSRQNADSLEAQALLPRLQAILRGDRDPALASDPALFYQDAVELMLLLEALGG